MKESAKKIAIIGGGAAGFFAAINLKRLQPDAEVTIFEASEQPLAKVAVSGGGRCNLTNTFLDQYGEPLNLIKVYPRGEKIMRNCLRQFDQTDCYEWFEREGVKLVTQEDQCVFPKSQDSYEIIELFYSLCDELGVIIKKRHFVESIRKEGERFKVLFGEGLKSYDCDYLLATTGGSPKREGMNLYNELPIRITDLAPSLFSLKIPNNPITELTGAVIENAQVTLKGGKVCGTGAMLITHWGVSGPAVLKLSSYCAKRLKEEEYKGAILINWVGITQDEIGEQLRATIDENGKKMVGSLHPFGLTTRVWEHILQRSDISLERRVAELGSKGINRIIATLASDEYQFNGRGTNKEEFVTCGGIAVGALNPRTLESHDCKGLFFAGEVIDLDAITGGFNLQAAWTTAFAASTAISYYLND
ncbi:MAG: aminoacetone oxidase family FAD-binding enzyme [Rikenellaceae bacterium]